MSSSRLESPQILEVDVDYDAHFQRAWEVAQTIWDVEEDERRKLCLQSDDAELPQIGHLFDGPLSPLTSSPSDDSAFDSPLSSLHSSPSTQGVSLPPEPSARIPADIPTHVEPLSVPHRSTNATSHHTPGTTSQPSPKKRKRRDNWSQEKIDQEKRKLKAKKQKKKAEGTAPPRKRSQSQRDKKKARREREKEARYTEGEGPNPMDYNLPKHAFNKWGKPEEVTVDYAMEDATAAKGAYVGVNRPVDVVSGGDRYTLEGELAKGRQLVEWDGVYVLVVPSVICFHANPYFSCSTPTALVDKKRRMLSILAGHPNDPMWQQDVVKPAATLFDEIRIKGDSCDGWSTKQQDARRGDFISLTSGVSYGGGQQVRRYPLAAHAVADTPFLPSGREISSTNGRGKFRSLETSYGVSLSDEWLGLRTVCIFFVRLPRFDFN